MTYAEIAAQIGKLVTEKDAAYGSAFRSAPRALALLYPEGIKPHQYIHALLMVRIWDKMQRIATNKDAFGESPYRDIAGYGIIGATIEDLHERRADERPWKDPQREIEAAEKDVREALLTDAFKVRERQG